MLPNTPVWLHNLLGREENYSAEKEKNARHRRKSTRERRKMLGTAEKTTRQRRRMLATEEKVFGRAGVHIRGALYLWARVTALPQRVCADTGSVVVCG